MTLAALVAVIAVAALVQVVSGFGFALVAAPVLVAVTGPLTSVSILAVLGTLTSVVTLAAGRERPQPARRTAATLVAWAIPGTAVGVLVVSGLPEDPIRLAIGLLVLAVLVGRLRGDRPRRAGAGGRLGRALAGLTAGAMTTSTGLNGPPLVLHLTALDVEARAARDTLAVCFIALDVLGVVALAIAGELRLPTETLALPAAAIVGGLTGHRIFDRLDEPRRRAAVTAILVASAATAIASALT